MFDASLMMSNGQSVTASAAATDVLRLVQNDKIITWQSEHGSAKSKKRGLSVGAGIKIYAFVQAAITAGGAGTVSFTPKLVNSANDTILTGDATAVTFPSSGTLATSSVNTYLSVREIDSGILDEDYIGIFYTVAVVARGGSIAASSVTAGLTLDKSIYLELKTAARENRTT